MRGDHDEVNVVRCGELDDFLCTSLAEDLVDILTSCVQEIIELCPRPVPIAPAQALHLSELITPTPHGIASRILAKNIGGSLTLFAFDMGQGLSEHTAPFDAIVMVLEGRLGAHDRRQRGHRPRRHDRPHARQPAACRRCARTRAHRCLTMLREPKVT